MIHQAFGECVCSSPNHHGIALQYMFCPHIKNYRAFMILIRHVIRRYLLTTDIYKHVMQVVSLFHTIKYDKKTYEDLFLHIYDYHLIFQALHG